MRYNPPSTADKLIKRCQNELISQRSGAERGSMASELECQPGVAGRSSVDVGGKAAPA